MFVELLLVETYFVWDIMYVNGQALVSDMLKQQKGTQVSCLMLSVLQSLLPNVFFK